MATRQKRKPTKGRTPAARARRSLLAARPRLPTVALEPHQIDILALALIAIGVFLGGVAVRPLGRRSGRGWRRARDEVLLRRAGLRGSGGAGRGGRLDPRARAASTGPSDADRNHLPDRRADAGARRRDARGRPRRRCPGTSSGTRPRSRPAAACSGRPSCGSPRTCSRRSARACSRSSCSSPE